jgi:hypothetical protein
MRAEIPIKMIKVKKSRCRGEKGDRLSGSRALEIKKCHINQRIPLRGKIRERGVKP